MRVLAQLLCIVTHVWRVNANVEKTIFLGPSAVVLPHVQPSLNDLRLHSLSHLQTILPTVLPVHFPSETAPHGREFWYLLQHLEAGRRYEVRICWPATVSQLCTICAVQSCLSSPTLWLLTMEHKLMLTLSATNRLLAGHLYNHPSVRHSGTHIFSCTIQRTASRAGRGEETPPQAGGTTCSSVCLVPAHPGSRVLLLDKPHIEGISRAGRCGYQYAVPLHSSPW
jgi:hypothetical protein